jgi:hypothetical protein
MRGTWSSSYLRAQLAGSWVEVQRDTDAPVLSTILSEDGHVFIIYPDKMYAVVPSARPGRADGQA